METNDKTTAPAAPPPVFPQPGPAYNPNAVAYNPTQPAQPGYSYPPPAYGQPAYGQPAPAYGQPAYGQPTGTTTVVVAQPHVRAIGSCAYCGGFLQERFTVAGIILALCCFPWGLICCFMMRERRCVSCGR